MYYNELPYGEPIEVYKKPESSLFIVSGEYKIKLKPEAKSYSWFIFKNKIDIYGKTTDNNLLRYFINPPLLYISIYIKQGNFPARYRSIKQIT